MANGILVDEATYFNDNETYTGDSGSETNRYVIEDVYDFLAIGTNKTYKNYRLINNIDMRDHSIYKTGFNNTAMIKDAYGSFDGDGHEIRNIVLNNYTGSDVQNVAFMNFSTIANVDFKNLVIMDCSATCSLIFCGASGNTVSGQKGLVNCNFGIFVANSIGKALPLYNDDVNDCCFNIEGKLTNDSPIILSQRMKRTHINLDLNMNYNKVFKINGSGTASSIYITGKIKNLTTLSYDKYSTSEAILNTGSLTNSYIAVEYDGPVNENISQTISINGTGFIDKELWCKNGFNKLANVTNSTTSLNTITTAQAQDADYLNSIGFAVVPVE